MPERQFVRCPSCSSTFSVPTSMLSLEFCTAVNCSFCGEEIQVSAPLPEASPSLPVWVEDEWGSEDHTRS